MSKDTKNKEIKLADVIKNQHNAVDNDNNIEDKVNIALVDIYSHIKRQLSILKIAGVFFGTKGDFSVLSGKSKSKKTFFLTLLVASFLSENNFINSILKTQISDGKVLYFDTEQSSYHVQKVGKRIVKMTGLKKGNNKLKLYGLRKYSPLERLQIIEYVIYNNKTDLIIIDGIADLINNGYNDEADSIMIASKLLKWSEELNVHIITVIHQNKGDNNSKGHLGAQLSQKAETVLNVEKTKENKDYSVITPSLSRGIDIDDIYFTVDDDGIPIITDAPEKNSIIIKKLPKDFTDNENFNLIKDAFRLEKELSYRILLDNLKHYLLKDGHTVGEVKLRSWITYYVEIGAIKQLGVRKPYVLVNEFFNNMMT